MTINNRLTNTNFQFVCFQAIGTYYWSPIDNTDYVFAFSLGESDEKFREVRQPKNLSMYDLSFFNLLIEYNSSKAREVLPGKFEHMQVSKITDKYKCTFK